MSGPRVIAGIGCRRGCPAEDIVALVRRAEAAAGCRVGALAAPAAKGHETGPHGAAAQLGVPLLLVAAAPLAAAQDRCVTRSACAARTLGVAAVAEGCALAAAGEGGALVLPRIASARATCALAAEPSPSRASGVGPSLSQRERGLGPRSEEPLSLWEREGPIAQQWEGEGRAEPAA